MDVGTHQWRHHDFGWVGGDCDGVVLGERIELGRFKLLRFGTVLRDEWWREPDVGRFIYRAGLQSARGQCHCRCGGGGWHRSDYYYYCCSFRPRRRPLSLDRSSHRALNRPRQPSRSTATAIAARSSSFLRPVDVTAAAVVKAARRTAPTPCRHHVTRYAASEYRPGSLALSARPFFEQPPQCCSSRRPVTAEHHARLPLNAYAWSSPCRTTYQTCHYYYINIKLFFRFSTGSDQQVEQCRAFRIFTRLPGEITLQITCQWRVCSRRLGVFFLVNDFWKFRVYWDGHVDFFFKKRTILTSHTFVFDSRWPFRSNLFPKLKH